VESGETFSTISRKFRISTVALAEANLLSRNAQLAEGSRLLLPLAPGNEASLARVRERGARHPYRYQVRPGDTLEIVADRFDDTPYEIRRWNSLKTSRLVVGKSLLVYVVGGSAGGSRRSRGRRKTAPQRSQAAKTAGPSDAPQPKKAEMAPPDAPSTAPLVSR
jgi:membrane-bound lytic murein transglycosylase D